MLTYNTQLKKLVLPEYGRHIQDMVDHCKTIEDRDKRTQCAHTIVGAMRTLFPPAGDPEEYKYKLWDHLAIMSDFDLDIDWPFEVVRKDDLGSRPDQIFHEDCTPNFPHYGKLLEVMIWRASEMPEGPERDTISLMLANHMKKILVAANPNGVEDSRVFKDLRLISGGVFNFSPETTHLHEFKTIAPPKKKKKK